MVKGLSLVAAEGVIRRKVQAWLQTIEDKDLRAYLKDKIVVAGGSVASLLMGEEVNDFDIYFTTRDAAVRVAYYYVKRYAANPPMNKASIGCRMWVEVVYPHHVAADGTMRHTTGDVVQVDDEGVMHLNSRDKSKHMREFVEGPKCPHPGEFERECLGDFHYGRVRIVIKSVGVLNTETTAEDKEYSYQYFESLPPKSAGDYVKQETGPAHASEEDKAADAALAATEDDEDEEVDAALAAQLYDAAEGDVGRIDIANSNLVELAEDFAKANTPPKQTGPGAAAKNKYRPVFMSGNAITLSDRVQLIIRFYGCPDTIISNFDFVHTTCYWTSAEGKITVNNAALQSMLSRKLKYCGSKYPLCTLMRTRKFVARGWTAPASVFTAAMHQCTKLDWDKVTTWEDQLIGMDAAYFTQIIGILREEKAKGKTIDGTYVVELIDRMM